MNDDMVSVNPTSKELSQRKNINVNGLFNIVAILPGVTDIISPLRHSVVDDWHKQAHGCPVFFLYPRNVILFVQGHLYCNI